MVKLYRILPGQFSLWYLCFILANVCSSTQGFLFLLLLQPEYWIETLLSKTDGWWLLLPQRGLVPTTFAQPMSVLTHSVVQVVWL